MRKIKPNTYRSFTCFKIVNVFPESVLFYEVHLTTILKFMFTHNRYEILLQEKAFKRKY